MLLPPQSAFQPPLSRATLGSVGTVGKDGSGPYFDESIDDALIGTAMTF
jgi:hypothetical protein